METPKKCPCLAACASLRRLPSPFAMTHMRWRQGQCGHESTEFTVLCGPLCRWVVSLAHRCVLETRTWAEVNVRPRPLVNKQAPGQDRTGQDRTKKTRQDKTRQDKTRQDDHYSQNMRYGGPCASRNRPIATRHSNLHGTAIVATVAGIK